MKMWQMFLLMSAIYTTGHREISSGVCMVAAIVCGIAGL